MYKTTGAKQPQPRLPRNVRHLSGSWLPSLLVFALLILSGCQGRQPVHLNIPYAGSDSQPTQTFDLYLPEKAPDGFPLMIVVPGGFWGVIPEQFQVTRESIQRLRAAGTAVAIVRQRAAPAHKHPAQAYDLAAAVAHLMNHAGEYGYARDKIYLAGHSSGGHLAALVALDAHYLNSHHLRAKELAGVVILNGILDVTKRAVRNDIQRRFYDDAFGADPELRRQASPVQHIGRDTPPFLVLSAENDLPGFQVEARRFVMAMRKSGNTRAYHHVISREDHVSGFRLSGDLNAKRTYVLEFLGLAQPTEFFVTRLAARRVWHDPPLSTEPFWKYEKLIKSYLIDKRLKNNLVAFFQGNAYMLNAWPLETYHAIDLFAYLDALGPAKGGRGDYLVTTNVRNEKIHWRRQNIEQYQPVIVVGIDDERNLYRFSIFYQALKQYSWIDEKEQPPLMVRSLGAFIHFRKPPPPKLQLPFPADSGLMADSFRLMSQDPLRKVRDIPKAVFDVMTHKNGCFSCHSFRNVGTRSHHLTAIDMKAYGAFALPLESYRPDVWHEFLYNQEAVAKKIGVTANPVPGNVRKSLYEMVEKARENAGAYKASLDESINSSAAGR